ncbi:hypothetical protein ABV409_04205 [Flagellimonas sp. DF-77]|uniref:hypothetical protein n=1 Tax=Flagellimonas algarum TaxID=3230298 RepID=UPI00339567BB
MKLGLFTIIAIVYFFFNSFGLPFGLRYTLFLAPFLFFQVSKTYWRILLLYVLLAFFYFIIHYVNGIVDYFEYFKSFLLHSAVMFLVIGFYHRLKKKPESVFEAIRNLTWLNLIATLFAVCVIWIPIVSDKIWRMDYSADSSPQLRMLTYEPSYYCLLLAPLLFYYISKIEKNAKLTNVILLGSLVASLLLSRSLGVIACIILSLAINYVRLDFLKKKRNLQLLFFTFLIVTTGLATLVIVNPDNALVIRTLNFINGKDISGSARVFDAWVLGYRILEQKSYLFGIGWGHIKILGHEIISEFYNYGSSLNKRVTIPNSAAEFFVFFGFTGLFLKVWVELHLFRKTRVRTSRYRSFLFWFIFIYQFTGSFSSNLAEYVIWVLAFTQIRIPDSGVGTEKPVT